MDKIGVIRPTDNLTAAFSPGLEPGQGYVIARDLFESTAKPGRVSKLAFVTTYDQSGVFESRWFQTSLDGVLMWSTVIHGKRNQDGRLITDAHWIVESVDSSEIKERFQHEMELWLKRIHLKKEWRATRFSGGVLKKNGEKR